MAARWRCDGSMGCVGGLSGWDGARGRAYKGLKLQEAVAPGRNAVRETAVSPCSRVLFVAPPPPDRTPSNAWLCVSLIEKGLLWGEKEYTAGCRNNRSLCVANRWLSQVPHCPQQKPGADR
jgi:hypothetical protein